MFFNIILAYILNSVWNISYDVISNNISSSYLILSCEYIRSRLAVLYLKIQFIIWSDQNMETLDSSWLLLLTSPNYWPRYVLLIVKLV